MQVRVKLFAMLREFLPPGSDDGYGIDLEIAEGATPRVIIEQWKLPPELVHLVMIDGFHLLPKEIEERILQPGETLAIFPPIAGG